MKNLVYLFAALSVIWAGVGLYLLRLVSLRRDLQIRIARLEEQFVERSHVDD